MNKPTLYAILCLGGLFASTHLNAGAYYKWVDENGVTHYTDKPPQNATSEKVTTTKLVPKTHAQVAEEAAAAKEAVAQAKRDSVCQEAKQRLATLQNNTTIQMRSPDGEVKTLTTEEIQREISISRDNVKRVCEDA